jgi:hypothetical protein
MSLIYSKAHIINTYHKNNLSIVRSENQIIQATIVSNSESSLKDLLSGLQTPVFTIYSGGLPLFICILTNRSAGKEPDVKT